MTSKTQARPVPCELPRDGKEGKKERLVTAASFDGEHSGIIGKTLHNRGFA